MNGRRRTDAVRPVSHETATAVAAAVEETLTAAITAIRHLTRNERVRDINPSYREAIADAVRAVERMRAGLTFRAAVASGADTATVAAAHDAVIAAALASGDLELVSYSTLCTCTHRFDAHRDDLRVCRDCDCGGFTTEATS